MKKRSRQILSVLLIVCLIIIQIPTVIAEGEAAIEIGPAYFTDGLATITQLEANSPVLASILVTNSGSVETNVDFIVAEYLNGQLQRVDIDQKTIGASRMALMEAGFTTGEDVTGVTMKAFVWESDTIKPFVQVGTFPGNDATLLSVTVNGEPLAGFSNDTYEYQYEIAPDEDDIPDVKAIAKDNCADVQIIDPVIFPGETIIKVTSADGTVSKEFKIQYQVEEIDDMVYDLEYLGPTSDPDPDDGIEPNFEDSSVLGKTLYLFDADDRSKDTRIFSNNERLYKDFAPELQDLVTGEYPMRGYHIEPDMNYNNLYGTAPNYVKNAWMGSQFIDWYRFKVKRTVEVILINQSAVPKFATAENGWAAMRKADPYYLFAGRPTSQPINFLFKASKTYTASIDSPTTITLPNAGISGWPYLVIFRPVYKKPDVLYNGPMVSPTDSNKNMYSYLPTMADNLQEGSNLYVDRDYKIINIHPAIGIKGNRYLLQTMNFTAGSGDYKFVGDAWVTDEYKEDFFTINLAKSAYLMMFVEHGRQPGWATPENGWFEVEAPKRGYFYTRKIDPELSNVTRLFVKEYNVAPGETVVANLPNAGTYSGTRIYPYLVVVRYK